MEKPYGGNVVLTETTDRIIVEISARRLSFTIVFLGVWLCGCSFFIVFLLINMFINYGFDAELLLFILLFSIVGLLVFRRFLWILRGKQILAFEGEQLTIRKRGAFFNKPQVYKVREIENVRLNKIKRNTLYFLNPWGDRINSGTVSFDYELLKKNIFPSLTIDEATLLLKTLIDKGYLYEGNFECDLYQNVMNCNLVDRPYGL